MPCVLVRVRCMVEHEQSPCPPFNKLLIDPSSVPVPSGIRRRYARTSCILFLVVQPCPKWDRMIPYCCVLVARRVGEADEAMTSVGRFGAPPQFEELSS
jgi:hypothetical protein